VAIEAVGSGLLRAGVVDVGVGSTERGAERSPTPLRWPHAERTATSTIIVSIVGEARRREKTPLVIYLPPDTQGRHPECCSVRLAQLK